MRQCTVEMDKTRGVKWPRAKVRHNERTFSLQSIFQQAEMKLDLKKNNENLPFPSDSNGIFDRAMLHRFMVKHRMRERQNWHAYVLIVPRIEYFRDGRVRTPNGVMFDYRSHDQNAVPREGCALAFQKVGQDQRIYLRVLCHELGHVFNLKHPSSQGTRLMNPSGDLIDLGNYPDNIRYRFSRRNRRWLATKPAEYVRPGGKPYGSNDLEDDDARAPARADGLRLEISTRQDHYLMGMPVRLRLALSNTSETPITVDRNFLGHHLRVELILPDGGGRQFCSGLLACGDREPMTLAPGATLCDSLTISLGSEGYQFTSPGVYRIRARYHDHAVPGVVYADHHEIEITTPANDRQRELSDLLTAPGEALFLYLCGGAERHAERIGKILTRIPRDEDSDVRIALAHHLLMTAEEGTRVETALDLLQSLPLAQLDHEQVADRHGLAVLAGIRLQPDKVDGGAFIEAAQRCGQGDPHEILQDLQDYSRDRFKTET